MERLLDVELAVKNIEHNMSKDHGMYYHQTRRRRFDEIRTCTLGLFVRDVDGASVGCGVGCKKYRTQHE